MHPSLKFLALFSVLAAFTKFSPSANAQALLSEGQSYDFSFSSLSLSSVSSEPFGWFVDVSFAIDLVESGEILLIELLEDSNGDVPFASTTPVGLALGSTSWGFGSIDPSPDWDDLQGIVRFRMEAGSVGVNSIQVTKYLAGNSYSQTFVIPEPASAAMLLVGTALSLVVRRHFIRCKPEPLSSRMKPE